MNPDELPRLGFGTVGVTDPETIVRALDVGYRHIDTAQWYENEHIVGEGIARSEVPREEVIVTTKVLPENLAREDVLKTTEESRQRLGIDVIDLLYVHWPTNAYDADGTLGAFDTLYDETKIRGVGLSNFTPALLDEARNRLDAPLVAHQVEMHPFLPQRELVNHAQQHEYNLVAYSPLAQGAVFDDPVLHDIAAEHGVSIAQIALAWLFETENVCAIPKASGDHIQDNYGALDIDLTAEDIARIDGIDRELRTVDPADEGRVDRTPWEE